MDVLIVDTILLTTGDTDLHLKPDANLGHALQVLNANLNVLFLGLLRQVEHVRAEKRFASLRKVLFISRKHTIEPRKQLLGTVVRVQNDGNAVAGSNRANVVRSGGGTSDRSLLLVVGKTLTSEVGSATLRQLQDDRRLRVTSGFKSGVGHGRSLKVSCCAERTYSHVESRDGKVVLTSVVEHLVDILARNNTSRNNVENTHIG